MNWWIRCFLFLSTLLLISGGVLLAAGDIKEEATGKTFPAVKEFGAGEKMCALDCAGVGVRKKFVVKVYGLGFYVDHAFRLKMKDKWMKVASTVDALVEKDGFFRDLVQELYCRQFEMKFVHEVDAEKIRTTFTEGIEANLKADRKTPEFKKALQQFQVLFQKVVLDGDVLTLNLHPDGTVEAFHNGTRLGAVQNLDLMKGLTGVWLGDECISDSLKEDLVRLFYQ